MTHPFLNDHTIARLKQDFDQAFARPPEARADRQSFLGLGLRGDPYALRIAQIESVLAERRIVPLPATIGAFAGLIAHRGSLVPVYDLGILLGYAAATTPRWIVTVRASHVLVGLGFDRVDGHYQVIAAGSSPAGPSPSRTLSVVPGLPDGRPVIDLPSLLEPMLHPQANEPTKGVMNP